MDRAAGGMGGRPGEAMCAVLDGRRVGRLCVRGPGPWPGPARAVEAADEGWLALWLLMVLLLPLLMGGEYGGMGSPLDTVVW